MVKQRGVSVAQAARDLDLHGTVSRRWIGEFRGSPDRAFPGKGLMQPEAEEVRRLRREVGKLKAERNVLKKPQPTSPETICNVQVYCEAPGDLADQLDV